MLMFSIPYAKTEIWKENFPVMLFAQRETCSPNVD